jgi:competence protein ComEC
LLVRRQGDALQADILVAPHHGSKTSSTAAFVRQVKPDYVLFATGYRNHFGFPKSAVVERWREAGAITLNTAVTGALQFQLGDSNEVLTPSAYRRANPRVWSAAVRVDE